MRAKGQAPREEFTFQVELKRARRPPPKSAKTEDLPKAACPSIVRALVLGYQIEDIVRSGRVRDYTEAGRLLGLTGARVSQIVGLTMLSPEIQEAILSASLGSRLSERNMRSVAFTPGWKNQRRHWMVGL